MVDVLDACNSGFCNRITRNVGTADIVIVSVDGLRLPILLLLLLLVVVLLYGGVATWCDMIPITRQSFPFLTKWSILIHSHE
jgi:hypothetical protein